MTHLIREFTKSDTEDIKECIIELQEFERLIDPHRLEGMKIAHQYLDHLLEMCTSEKGKLFVVEINNEIVGMISVIIEEGKKHMRKVQRHAVISDLIVMQEYRGRGIGKELIQKAEEYARSKEVTNIQIHLLKKNPEGLNMYLRNGFEEFEIVLRKRV